MADLTEKQKRFCDEYLIDLNGTQAAIRAGYSENTASEIASENLRKPSISSYVLQRIEQRAKRTEITQDRVLREFARIGFSDMRKFATWGSDGVALNNSGELNDEDASCVAEVSQSISAEGGSIKFKLHDKKGALDSIARHLGMFIDKTEATNTNLNLNVDADKLKELPQEDLEAAIALGEKLNAALNR